MTSRARAAGAWLRAHAGPLDDAAFRRLWLAHGVSQVGSEITILALPLVAILVLRASALDIALLGTIQFVAFSIVALPAGVWVDRLPRRQILIAADLGRSIVLLAVPMAAALGILAMWQLYAITFVASVLTVFSEIADQAILSQLVGRERLAQANSRLEVNRSVAQMLGPGVGGALIALLTAPTAIVVDALSYLASAAFLIGIRLPTRDPLVEPVGPAGSPVEVGRPRPGVRREIVEGLRFYRRSPLLLSLSAASLVRTVGIWIAGSTFLVFLARDLAMTPEAIGLGFSIGAIGYVIGAAAAATTGRRFGIGRTLIVGSGISALSWCAWLFAGPATAFVFLVATGLVQGLSEMAVVINGVSLRQALAPESLQGRISATARWITWTAVPLGAILGGVVATVAGIPTAIALGSALAMLSVPVLVVSPLRALREAPPTDAFVDW